MSWAGGRVGRVSGWGEGREGGVGEGKGKGKGKVGRTDEDDGGDHTRDFRRLNLERDLPIPTRTPQISSFTSNPTNNHSSKKK